MSGNNFARKVQRAQLHAGKIKPEQYAKLRRALPVSSLALSINAMRRSWAKMARFVLVGDETSEERFLQNLLAQCHLVEAVYHPTKGWRFSRGEPV